MNIRFTIGTSLLFLLAVTLIFGSIYMLTEGDTTSSPGTSNEVVTYNIVEEEDLSFSTAIRIGVRLTMNADVTQQEIEWIAQDVVSNITKQQLVNAISIGMYHYGDDYYGVARVVVFWAPYGDWSRAIDVTTGDYQYHQYSYNYY